MRHRGCTPILLSAISLACLTGCGDVRSGSLSSPSPSSSVKPAEGQEAVVFKDVVDLAPGTGERGLLGGARSSGCLWLTIAGARVGIRPLGQWSVEWMGAETFTLRRGGQVYAQSGDVSDFSGAGPAETLRGCPPDVTSSVFIY